MASRPDPVDPEPGQESVWDYPRPPRLEPVDRRLRVVYGGEIIADTTDGWRVLETSHPPNYYFPPEDVHFDLMRRLDDRRTLCEWKGRAHYYDIAVDGAVSQQAAWGYDAPTDAFGELAGAVAFYAGRVDEAYVGDELVTPQPGGFYGGWVTSDVVGPFKGEPGSRGW
jgi:uncharacterized protein (DUF427 family)